MSEILFSAQQVNDRKLRQFGRKPFFLENINFDLPEGYIMGLIGKNGAGKTTFFDYIMNEKKRYSGRMLLAGKDIHEDHLQTLHLVGFLSENNEFLETRTGRQNAQMLGRFYTDFDMELFQQTMDALEISPKKTVGVMSRGELMKFQLAFAAAHHPRLYLLDEATAGMDPVFRIDFYRMLRKLLDSYTGQIAWFLPGIFSFLAMILIFIPVQELKDGDRFVYMGVPMLSIWISIIVLLPYLNTTEPFAGARQKFRRTYDKLKYLPISRQQYRLVRLGYLFRYTGKLTAAGMFIQCLSAALLTGYMDIWNVIYVIITLFAVPMLTGWMQIVLASTTPTYRA